MTLAGTRPTPGPPRPYRFPRFERERLANGMQVVRCHVPGRPIGSALLVTEAGAAYEAAAEGGVGALAARTLTEGTELRDAAAFTDAAERIGADIGAGCDWDSFHVGLDVPVARMGDALELLAEAVRRPAFPEREVERLRDERLSRIKQEYANPASRGRLAFLEAVYIAESPYARPVEGTATTVAGLDRDRVFSFYRTYSTPSSATLVLACDLDRAQVDGAAERLFEDWRAPEPGRAQPLVAGAVERTSVTLVHRPGAVQSQLAVGHIGLERSTPDYAAVRIVEAVLGGLFNSRLEWKLREEKGYTYFAFAQFDLRRQAGPFICGAAPQTAVTVDAVADTLAEIRTLRDGGVTAEELETAREYIVGVAPLRYETPDRIADAIGQLAVYGLPDDYYDTQRERYEALTVEDVLRAAREHLHPDRTAVVVVGDAEALEGPMRAAGFGPVTVIEDPPPGR